MSSTDGLKLAIAAAVSAERGRWQRMLAEDESAAIGVIAEIAAGVARARDASLEKRVDALAAVAKAAREATVWDYTVYEEIPGADWIAIDRADWAQLLGRLGAVDQWAPWQVTLERRLEGI